AAMKPPADPSGADGLLAKADLAYGAGNYADAAKAYREAITKGGTSWPHYTRAVESGLWAMQSSDDNAGALALARESYSHVGKTVSAANVAGSGLDCAVQLPAETAGRAEAITTFQGYVRDILGDTSLDLQGDDVSGLYGLLTEAAEDAKDSTAAHDWTAKRAAALEAAAAKAPNPDARSVFDSHRLACYIDLGQPERAIPMLQASERDLPEDYNPPARLALAYKAM